MKRWIQHAIIGTALAGCVQQDATQPQIETAEATTCPGPGNYPYPIPPTTIPIFNGSVKTPSSPYQHLVTSPNPDVQGWSVVALVDLSNGSVPWAASFVTSNLAKVHQAAPDQPWLDILRPPPPPPPIGTHWMSAYLLEATLIYVNTPDIAAANVASTIPIPQ